ncbi:MAG: OmpA family protein [Candidatus Dependentiae bacterium]|nr:OmpA family protein [Candidatus Dependentiae bacterium]
MKKYIHIFLCLLIVTTGCAKKKDKTVTNKQSSAKKSHVKHNKKTTFDENLEAFALDDDSLHNFAHDMNNESQQDASTKPARHANSIFQWEDAQADQSKEDFKTIYFEFDKHKIKKDQEANLQANIDYAKKMIGAGKIIVIEGHACDSAGSAVYNMTLSEQRAKFIATKFMDASIDKSNIKIAARGQEMPVVKGGNKHQQAVNRRVEIYAIDNK